MPYIRAVCKYEHFFSTRGHAPLALLIYAPCKCPPPESPLPAAVPPQFLYIKTPLKQCFGNSLVTSNLSFHNFSQIGLQDIKYIMKRKLLYSSSLLALAVSITACHKNNSDAVVVPKIKLENYSVNPSLVKTMPGFENLAITTMISSDDVLPQSPNFIFGAQPDGAAILKNPAGEGFVMINNHEILQAVSRVYLDKNLKPIKGEYILNSDGGLTRLCSATMATPEEHGFSKPLFLTAGESGAESSFHGVDPFNPGDASTPKILKAFGKWSAENAVPLPKSAYPGKTVVMIGEDEGDGQVAMYLSNAQGDIENGKVYVLKRTNNNPVETDMTKGSSYDVEFVEIVDAKNITGAAIQQQTVAKNAVMFARVEDLDYKKGNNSANGREIYFVATGVSASDKLTPVNGKTMWGRLYKLVLDANDPLKGKLEVVVDGADNPGKSIVNPDNVCVTENFVYIQEDGDSFYKLNDHDGNIWQYSLASKSLKPMIQMNHRRNESEFNAKYNAENSKNLSSWEYGAMYDISDLTGLPNTFVVNIHPHTWKNDKYKNADKGVSRLRDNNEGGQVVIIQGVEK